MKYAGVFRRLAAFLVDTAFLLLLYFLLYFLSGVLLQIRICLHCLFEFFFPLGFPFLAGFFSLNWLYFAFLESSSWQATFGKKLLHLQVTTLEGKRISFWRATRRHFGKMLSRALAFLGLFMIFFTKKKQALHDKMACTVIVQKEKHSLLSTQTSSV